LLSPGPTLAGFESRALAQAEPAIGALRITRNPFLWGVAFWAAGHLLANGERWAVMLFGALGAMVLFGTRSIDRKGAARNPEAWARFEAATSNVPFVAIMQGRNNLVFSELWWRLLLAFARFSVLVALSSGEIISAAYFPKGSAFGIDLGLGLGFRILPALQIRAGFDFTRYGLSFTSTAADTYQGTGASDVYLGGHLSLRFEY
jgi:hypothetical protein